MIYFLQAEPGGPIKIGCTKNLKVRLRELQGDFRRPLVVFATQDGDRKDEAAIHSRFAHLRLGWTEQFRPTPELLEFLGLPVPLIAVPDDLKAMQPKWLRNRVRMKKSLLRALKILAYREGMTAEKKLAEILEQALADYINWETE